MEFVFTDINMPVMTGTELLREIADARPAGIVRVVISTDGSDSRRDEVGLSVAVYVEKPFRPEDMRDVLTSLSAAS